MIDDVVIVYKSVVVLVGLWDWENLWMSVYVAPLDNPVDGLAGYSHDPQITISCFQSYPQDIHVEIGFLSDVCWFWGLRRPRLLISYHHFHHLKTSNHEFVFWIRVCTQ